MRDPNDLRPTPGADRARNWRRYLQFWGQHADADIDDELAFHLAMRARDAAERGLPDRDAVASAESRLGDVNAIREQCLDVARRRERRTERARLADDLGQDLSFAARTLRRSAGWSLVAVITLALGIGANTAVFSVLNSVILHPLSYPHADQVSLLYEEPANAGSVGTTVTITPEGNVVAAWKHSHSIDDIEGFNTSTVIVESHASAPVSLPMARIEPGFLRFAGAHPLLGRPFSTDDADGRAPVVELGEGVWRTRFGADTAVIGRSLLIDGRAYSIVGVLPSSLVLPRLGSDAPGVWLPLNLKDTAATAVGVYAVGRLRPGVTPEAAARELDSLVARSAIGAQQGAMQFKAILSPPAARLTYKDSLVMLSVAAALVLIIACANVTHLFLARSAGRRRELAIRAALGAGRFRIARQTLTETILLAVAGTVAGLGIAWLGVRALLAMRPPSLSELASTHIDGRVLAISVAVSLATWLVVGIATSSASTRSAPYDALKAGALSTTGSRGHSRTRSMLIVSEMALSTMLLVGAALLLRSVRHLQTADPGFRPDGLYSIDANLPPARYRTQEQRTRFYQDALDRVRGLPGMEGATIGDGAPPYSSFLLGALQVDGQPTPQGKMTSFVSYTGARAGYLHLMGISLTAGRDFVASPADTENVIVNAGLARKYWPGQSAVGHKLRVVFMGQGDWKTIIGVAGDAMTGGLLVNASDPMIYLSVPTHYSPTLFVRPVRANASAVRAAAAIVAQLDTHLPAPTVINVGDSMAQSIARPRFTMLLLSVFTALAAVLAGVGLYGVVAYSVTERTREFGIRIALGASRSRVACAAVMRGLVLTSAGMALGLLGAAWGSKLLAGMLHGVGRGDAVSFGASILALAAIALAASVLPARRAMAVDPLIAMRAE